MIIVLRPDATEEQVNHIVEKVKKLKLTPHVSKGTERTIIGVIGPEDILRVTPVSYTHLRAHETPEHLVCRLLLEKKKQKTHQHETIL